MAKVSIIFAHPALEKSRIHSRLIKQVKQIKGLSFRDLYEDYPDFDINIQREQQALLNNDIIIFQHPLYWYSTPAIIKEWLDLVLQHQWAYGSKGIALKGKKWMHVLSSGGLKEAYLPTGLNRFTIMELLAPFQQTASLCNMQFLPPFVIHGTHRLKSDEIENAAMQYGKMLLALQNDEIAGADMEKATYMNDLF